MVTIQEETAGRLSGDCFKGARPTSVVPSVQRVNKNRMLGGWGTAPLAGLTSGFRHSGANAAGSPAPERQGARAAAARRRGLPSSPAGEASQGRLAGGTAPSGDQGVEEARGGCGGVRGSAAGGPGSAAKGVRGPVAR